MTYCNYLLYVVDADQVIYVMIWVSQYDLADRTEHKCHKNYTFLSEV